MRLNAAFIALCFYSAPALAEHATPHPVLPEQLQWLSPPQIPGAQVSWMLGTEKSPAPYIFRVKLAKGTKVPPHTHPDERITTVLAGTLMVGFGNEFITEKMVAVPTGAVYKAPAGTPHYVWAKDDMVSYQESGAGPTGTVPIPH